MNASQIPEDFRTALLSLREARLTPTLHVEEIPAPRKIAPWSAALSIHTLAQHNDSDLASGGFIILHDPDRQPGWNGTFRIVAHMRTQVDPEMSADPLLSEALWNWAHDCLEEAGAGYSQLTGTVSKETSEVFGGLTLTSSRLYVELRASWTPTTPYLEEHLNAWLTLIERTSGIATFV